MPRSTPEKLAAALRANLRRRKQAPQARPETGTAPGTPPVPDRPAGQGAPPSDTPSASVENPAPSCAHAPAPGED